MLTNRKPSQDGALLIVSCGGKGKIQEAFPENIDRSGGRLLGMQEILPRIA